MARPYSKNPTVRNLFFLCLSSDLLVFSFKGRFSKNTLQMSPGAPTTLPLSVFFASTPEKQQGDTNKFPAKSRKHLGKSEKILGFSPFGPEDAAMRLALDAFDALAVGHASPEEPVVQTMRHGVGRPLLDLFLAFLFFPNTVLVASARARYGVAFMFR